MVVHNVLWVLVDMVMVQHGLTHSLVLAQSLVLVIAGVVPLQLLIVVQRLVLLLVVRIMNYVYNVIVL